MELVVVGEGESVASKGNVLGFHTSVQAGIVFSDPNGMRMDISPRFTGWLDSFCRDFLQRVEAIRRAGEGALAVGFFCKSGRHRSVACSALFRTVLERGIAQGVRYDGSHHQASFAWFPSTCGYCSLCTFSGEHRRRLNDIVATCWAGAS